MEEEEIKKKILEQRTESLQAMMQQEQAREALKKISSQLFDKKAAERMANIRASRPDMAMQIELYLAQLYAAGQLKRVTDEQLIAVLKKVTEKKEIKIKRR